MRRIPKAFFLVIFVMAMTVISIAKADSWEDARKVAFVKLVGESGSVMGVMLNDWEGLQGEPEKSQKNLARVQLVPCTTSMGAPPPAIKSAEGTPFCYVIKNATYASPAGASVTGDLECRGMLWHAPVSPGAVLARSLGTAKALERDAAAGRQLGSSYSEPYSGQKLQAYCNVTQPGTLWGVWRTTVNSNPGAEPRTLNFDESVPGKLNSWLRTNSVGNLTGTDSAR